MVIDRVENASLYYGLSGRLARAMEALESGKLLTLDVGRHELDGRRLVAIVQQGPTKPREQGIWEAHRRYIDVQYVVEGAELMGWSALSDLKERAPYDAERDIVFLDGEGSFMRVEAGMFAIFFPRDAHMPSLAVVRPQPVKKVVLKVLAE